MEILTLLWTVLLFVLGIVWQLVWFVLRDLISIRALGPYCGLACFERSLSQLFGRYADPAALRGLPSPSSWRWLRGKPGNGQVLPGNTRPRSSSFAADLSGQCRSPSSSTCFWSGQFACFCWRRPTFQS